MLPSTGYFKAINCPFYDNGSCDRPYCHFRHSKREDAASTATVAETIGQTQEDRTTAVVASNPEILQQLVTEAVKKVLADQEVTDTEKFSRTIVSQVVEGLKPTLSSSSVSSTCNTNAPNIVGKHISIPTSITKPVACVYNPTPIAELKKRHIPVAYTLTRDSKVAVKRKASPERIKPWLNVQEFSSSQLSEVTYKPTAIISTIDQDTVQNYVPTVKPDLSSLSSYDDSNDYQAKFKEVYYPKSKKKREEYVPKKVKAPLKTIQHLDDTKLDYCESEAVTINSNLPTVANELKQIKTLPSENSEDYYLDIEPKFSDDESIEDIMRDENNASKKTEQIKDSNEKEKENKNHYDVETSDINDSDKSQERHKQSDTSKSTSVEKEVRNDNHQKNELYRRHDRIKEKDKKDHHTSERRDKEKSKHKSHSRDKHRSSDKDKDRKTSGVKALKNSKSSSHKSRGHSNSRESKNISSRNDRDIRHKSERHERQKSRSSSKSNSKSSKHTSSKSDKRHHSESTGRSNNSSRKSTKHKESSEENLSDVSDSLLDNIHSFINNEILDLSDSDHDIEEECLKIFQEYKISDNPKVVSVKESSKQEEIEEELGKKRIAHPLANTTTTKQPRHVPPARKYINPQQKMYERWRLMREVAAQKAAEKATVDTKTQITSMSAVQPSSSLHKEYAKSASSMSNSDLQLNGNGRVRIAHVPYAKSLAMEKTKVAVTVNKSENDKGIDNKTTAQTTKRGIRVAHIPQVIPHLIRPEPLQITGTQKFSVNIRQHHTNIMHDICVQIYTNGDDAAQRAVKEEFACYEKCKALAVYKSSCMLATHRLRKEIDQATLAENSVGSSCNVISHEAVLAGKSKGSWSVIKTKKNTIEYKGLVLYNMLKKWIMTEEQLRINGFPRSHPDCSKGRVKVYATNLRQQPVLSKVPNERICIRCGKPYMVDLQGLAIQPQNCIYHWGRKFTFRGESKYSCCQQYGSADGCCDAKTHVWDYTDYENLRGYIKTLPRTTRVEEQGVYALDCEMCYTTHGLELTRVTVINEDCNVIYETLVKPQNPIIDYNSRFSGITEDNMKNVTTTLLDVQAALLTLFSEKTILVGHSLESDFKALKLLHDTVVDTSVMFPHKHGYPHKRALKNLCSEYLKKLIQNDVNGHDSNEDAVACMELILWKIKEEAKLQ